MTSVKAILARELTAEQIDIWVRLQEADPSVDSPYFRPEFTQAIAAVRDDVEVAVLERDGRPVGFFPFQRGPWNAGQPVGGRLSDFQGVIAAPDADWSAQQLVRGCRLSSWNFDHLIAAQRPFTDCHQNVDDSHYIDVSEGFESYEAARRLAGSKELVKLGRKVRKFEREIGPLRFEMHADDPETFETLIRWKSAQYQRTGLTDVFGFDWTVKLLEHLMDRSHPDLAGCLSALYVGDRLVAAHFGMRSRHVLHYWFPAYDTEFNRYSPGLILLAEIAKSAADDGIQRIDLGKGSERYKISMSSGTISLAEGVVECGPMNRLLRENWHRTRDWLRDSPLRTPALATARLIRPFREWLAFR